MKHKMYFAADNGKKFSEEWSTSEIKRTIDTMIRESNYKVPKYSVVSVKPTELGGATDVIIAHSKTGKEFGCTVGFAWDRYFAEPDCDIKSFVA